MRNNIIMNEIIVHNGRNLMLRIQNLHQFSISEYIRLVTLLRKCFLQSIDIFPLCHERPSIRLAEAWRIMISTEELAPAFDRRNLGTFDIDFNQVNPIDVMPCRTFQIIQLECIQQFRPWKIHYLARDEAPRPILIKLHLSGFPMHNIRQHFNVQIIQFRCNPQSANVSGASFHRDDMPSCFCERYADGANIRA